MRVNESKREKQRRGLNSIMFLWVLMKIKIGNEDVE